MRATLALHRSAGLVGLPNVGKSTLFNALVRAQLAAASNFPFTTIKRSFPACLPACRHLRAASDSPPPNPLSLQPTLLTRWCLTRGCWS